MYASSHDLGIKSSIEAEFWAIREGLKLCTDQNCLPVVLETDSLLIYNYINGIWDSPWSVDLMVQKINALRRDKVVELQHTWREGNKVADYFANLVFFFAGTESLIFHYIEQVPAQGRALISLDAEQFIHNTFNKIEKSVDSTRLSRNLSNINES